MIEKIEIDMVEDVKELIKCNPDVHISKKLKNKIDGLHNMDLVQTTRVFDKGIHITSVDHVTEEFMEKNM